MRDPLALALGLEDTLDTITLRVGIVSGTSPCEVNLSGQAGLSAAHLAAYTPVTNDTVLIAATSTDLIILGKIISGG